MRYVMTGHVTCRPDWGPAASLLWFRFGSLSRHVSTQERFMSFCWQNNKIPERKESLSQPRVCVCGLSSDPLGTWHARELTSGSTNWAIFRSANGLKVLQLSPYIFSRSDSRAAIILAFYQPKFKGFSFGFPLKDLWPANCARILVSRLQYARNGPWETRKMRQFLIEYHIFNRKL